MSRLQVGGLALEIDTGVVCKLIKYMGDGVNGVGKKVNEVWKAEFSEFVRGADLNLLTSYGYVESKYLIPLGDKQTQDELAKEKEHEPV